jgi:diguanylate cyclase (GGDEF)-like protein
LATRHRALTTANQELRENRSALQVANSTLERLARRDVVTGLGNRLAMNDAIADIQDRFDRYGHGFSVAMLDLDHFKSYNDTFGHQAGDLVLAAAGAGIALEIRPGDSAYRYGGEEFLIVYPNQTVATASTAVQRIRHRIERDSSRGDVAHSVTVSAGIAEARLGDHFDCVVRRADLALYQAKHDGRNQICAEPKNGSVTPE